MSLQEQVVAWHVRRFPLAMMEHVALKASEEVGEVASAVSAVVGFSSATGDGVPGEAADVVIALMALIGRWFPGVDLMQEVEKKLAVLTDPASGHWSASLP